MYFFVFLFCFFFCFVFLFLGLDSKLTVREYIGTRTVGRQVGNLISTRVDEAD